MSLISVLFLFCISYCQSILKEPPKLILNEYHSVNITVEYCPFELIKENVLHVNMTAHCFCIHNESTNESECSIPGPTLVMYNGTNALLKITNNLYGKRNVCQSPQTCQHFNSFTDLNIINIHTHGLHVSPQTDNPFDINILPTFKDKRGTSHIYNYSIISQHYPGTHYYHTHHHGSTTFHLNAGLFGALLVEHSPPTKYDIDNIKENILMFSWIRATSDNVCLSCNSNVDRLMNSMHIHNEVHSLCDLYCLYPQIERNNSGVSYNMQTDRDDISLFLVNGQFQPSIDDMYVNRFRRLRLINVMGSFYIQYKFPSENCQWYQIAADGIFFDEILNLSINTHLNELILPMGSRVDVLLKCNTAGVYKIYASENNQQSADQLSNLQRVTNGTLLFSIKVNEYDSTGLINLDLSNNITSLPSQESYPVKPYYLSNSFDNVFNVCLCHNSYDHLIDNLLGDNGACFVQMYHIMNHKDEMKHVINGLEFDPNIPLTYLKANTQFEFTFYPTEGHVLHQHVFPFQVQSNVGNSFIAKQYEWRDTVGNWNQSWKYRFYTYDFTGRILLHCHKSWDADVGMVSYYMVKSDVHENECHLFPKENTEKVNSLWIEIRLDSFTFVNLFAMICLILISVILFCTYLNNQTPYS